ncbi:uncharacterized protein CTRU02_214269 [Colletotrichum truncatum]|uniref:Uncharacterized protein n=1 Tax=Colletotrichum truncatum TaxID=5467 RepID=A0ACC3YI25_COLTU|nr:uncharacterized protein CTRU02_11342 [Colletotrichum truncatum]KAF6786084.1 hypothetical protein CTRU02_11342 [Colletotrichum truncatum]
MRHLFSLILVSSLAFGAPNRASVESDAPVFEIERFYAGGLPPTNRNFAMFSIRPTPGSGFANCSVNTETGPVVPTVTKMVCSDHNAITWSLEPMGTGMHFRVWYAFTSHGSQFGEIHFDPANFTTTTLQGGGRVQSYSGRHMFKLPTRLVFPASG